MEKHNGDRGVDSMNITEMGERYRKIAMKNYYVKYPMTHQEIKNKTRECLEIPIYLTLNQDILREIIFVVEKEELDDTDYLLLLSGIIMYEVAIWDI